MVPTQYNQIFPLNLYWTQLLFFDICRDKQDGILDENMTTDNVQKHNICTDVPSSQTLRSYLRNHYGSGTYPKFRKLLDLIN
jgi:hypothetical protein